jgi:hypothetical protein
MMIAFAGARHARTITETAQAIGISRSQLYEEIRHGRGPRVIKIGRRRLVTVEDCEAYLRGLSRWEAA